MGNLRSVVPDKLRTIAAAIGCPPDLIGRSLGERDGSAPTPSRARWTKMPQDDIEAVNGTIGIASISPIPHAVLCPTRAEITFGLRAGTAFMHGLM